MSKEATHSKTDNGLALPPASGARRNNEEEDLKQAIVASLKDQSRDHANYEE
jgi:hypothetical protein